MGVRGRCGAEKGREAGRSVGPRAGGAASAAVETDSSAGAGSAAVDRGEGGPVRIAERRQVVPRMVWMRVRGRVGAVALACISRLGTRASTSARRTHGEDEGGFQLAEAALELRQSAGVSTDPPRCSWDHGCGQNPEDGGCVR